MKYLRLLFYLLFMVFLTVLTQVGGIIWIVTLLISYYFKKKKRYLFPIIYLVTNILIIPPIATYFGRVRLPVFSEQIQPRNILYPLLFRNYVTPKLKITLLNAAEKLAKNGDQLIYLDANFPFYNGFPLVPHLSHSDGKKVDISLMYSTKEGKPTQQKPSVSGYGVFVKPDKNITSTNCLKKGYWQYDTARYATFGTIHTLLFDEKRTKTLLKILLKHSSTQKIFIEPYLKTTLGLQNYDKIRFHGCRAVRHDDHIHLQIK